jgi:hypothetical protein
MWNSKGGKTVKAFQSIRFSQGIQEVATQFNECGDIFEFVTESKIAVLLRGSMIDVEKFQGTPI